MNDSWINEAEAANAFGMSYGTPVKFEKTPEPTPEEIEAYERENPVDQNEPLPGLDGDVDIEALFKKSHGLL